MKERASKLFRMSKSTIILTVLIHWATTGAGQSNFAEEKYGYEFYFSKPNYLARTYQLHEDADVQLQNTAKETYALVMIEPKDLFTNLGATLSGPRDYYDLVAEPLINESTQVSQILPLEINGNPALQSEIIAPFDGAEIAYLLTVVETKSYYCQILCWTLKSYKDQYFEDFRKMAASFRENK